MFGVENGVDDELADVVVLQPVENCRALAAGANQPRHAEFGQVLRHRRRGLADMFGEFVHRTLGRGERPQNLNASGIGEHAEYLDDERGLLVGQPITNHLVICIHTRIVAQDRGAGYPVVGDTLRDGTAQLIRQRRWAPMPPAPRGAGASEG